MINNYYIYYSVKLKIITHCIKFQYNKSDTQSITEQVIFYTFQLLFNCIGLCVLCYAFLSAASHIYSKQVQIQVGVTN